jgi:hypothetical protein
MKTTKFVKTGYAQIPTPAAFVNFCFELLEYAKNHSLHLSWQRTYWFQHQKKFGGQITAEAHALFVINSLNYFR